MGAADWDVAHLREELRRIDDRGEVVFLEETDSTNSQCLHWLREGAIAGSEAGAPLSALRYGVVLTAHQRAGRGRLGRQWLGAPGASLTFSMWFRFRRSDLSGLSLAVGVVVCEAISARLAEEASRTHGVPAWAIALKWPNDLVHVAPEGRRLLKLGGILVEAVHHRAVCSAVVGVGINVSGFPLDSNSLSSGFSTLADSGCHLSPALWLRHVGPALLRGLVRFDDEGFAGFKDQFESLNALQGRRVQPAGSPSEAGVVEGVGWDGSLLLRGASGALKQVHASEVRLQQMDG